MPLRTLVVHVGGIGDFVLSCPALARLAEAGPVEVAGRVDRARLAVAGGLVEAAHDLDALDFSTLFSSPSARLTRFLERFDRAVVWMRDDGLIAQRLHDAGIHQVGVHPGLPPEGWTRHASEYYLSCIDAEPRVLPWPLLPVPPAPEKRDVIIHGGSGGKHKNWPLNCFAEVADALSRRGRRVSWCAGPAEDALCLPANAEGLRIEKLDALAACLAAARLYIGNDSGITHLAAAVGCPTVAVFGPTDPRVWAPLGRQARIVQGMPWPQIRDAIAAAESLSAEPGTVDAP